MNVKNINNIILLISSKHVGALERGRLLEGIRYIEKRIRSKLLVALT